MKHLLVLAVESNCDNVFLWLFLWQNINEAVFVFFSQKSPRLCYKLLSRPIWNSTWIHFTLGIQVEDALGHTPTPLHSVLSCHLRFQAISVLAGREYVSIWKNRARCDNFLKLCMVLDMDLTFSKTTAHKLGETPGGRYAKIQDGRHWKLKRPYCGSY